MKSLPGDPKGVLTIIQMLNKISFPPVSSLQVTKSSDYVRNNFVYIQLCQKEKSLLINTEIT